jgi:hypothetical protein
MAQRNEFAGAFGCGNPGRAISRIAFGFSGNLRARGLDATKAWARAIRLLFCLAETSTIRALPALS